MTGCIFYVFVSDIDFPFMYDWEEVKIYPALLTVFSFNVLRYHGQGV